MTGNNAAINYSYLIRPNALRLGFGTPKTPIGTDRNELMFNGGGAYTITSRYHWGFYCEGVGLATSATAMPADRAAMASAANWTKAYDDANIGIVAILSN